MVMVKGPVVVRLSTAGVELNWGKLNGGYVFATPVLGDDLVVYDDGKLYNIGQVYSVAIVEGGGASWIVVRTPNVPPERHSIHVHLPEGVNTSAALRR